MNSADESLLPFDLSEDHEMKRLALSVAAMLMTIGSITALYAQEAADTILLNGKIVTVDDYFSIQEAIAIQGERIAAVGSNEAIRALSGPDTRTIDLGGRTVIRGGPYRLDS